MPRRIGRTLPPAPRSRAAAIGLVIAGGVVLLAALLAVWAQRHLMDADRAAAHARDAVAQEAVQVEVARRVALEVGRLRPELEPAVPALEAVAERVVATPAFAERVGDAVREAHRLVFDGRARIGDVEVDVEAGQLRGRLVRGDSPLAELVPPGAEATLLRVDRLEGALLTARAVRHAVDELALALPAAALVLLALAVVVAPQRLRALGWVGWAVVAAGGGLLAVEGVGRALAARLAEGRVGHDAADAVIAAFSAPLRGWCLALLAAGLVLAGAARGLRGPLPTPAAALAAAVERARGLRPPARAGDALGAIALVAAGTLLVWLRDLLLPLVLAAAGLVLAYAGIARLVALAPRGPARPAAGAAVLAVGLVAAGALAAVG